jgi:NADPH:quinone reductase-like Zn-dependent oxidoreductase
MMKAIVQHKYGSSEVLELAEIDKPVAKEGEVLVRVHAASVHKGDWHLMKGEPYPIRAISGLRKPKNPVPGTDIAGTVEAVGKDVTKFAPGDEVFGWCTGGFAEYAAAAKNNFVPKPSNVTFGQAAAVGTSTFAALHALRDQGKVQSGQKVLITGASGGVGTFAVQIAKSYGAEVTDVCSTRNVDMVRSIGADHVIDYTKEDFTRNGQQYDLIIDTYGSGSLAGFKRALTPKGTYVLVGGATGRWLGLGRTGTIKTVVSSPFASQDLRAFLSTPKHEDLVTIGELVEAGKITPVIDKTYPLSETPKALRKIGEGHVQGKSIISVFGG